MVVSSWKLQFNDGPNYYSYSAWRLYSSLAFSLLPLNKSGAGGVYSLCRPTSTD